MDKPTVVNVSLEDFQPALLAAPAKAVAEGRLVALPTDTVYAIATNADNRVALENLCDLCGRSIDEPLTLLVSNTTQLDEFAEHVPPTAYRLMDRFWPGPLTLVLPKKRGGNLSLRYPANKITLALIQKAAVPVAAPSASLPGKTPATSAAEVAKLFGNKLDFIIDGGSSSSQGLSTVVKCSKNGVSIVRTGALSREALAEVLARSILFVCLGNTCRSPMAVGLIKKALADKLKVSEDALVKAGYNIQSAGTSAAVGEPMSEHARTVLREHGCTANIHAAQPITSHLIKQADFIFVMSESQRNAMLATNPEAAGRIELLDREGKSIEDPFGGTLEAYKRAASSIYKNIPALAKKVVS